jgi:hypothetical protein
MIELNIGEPFCWLARSYRRSADLLLGRLREMNVAEGADYLPVRFLYSHAVELLLKAFLRLRGVSVKALERKPYRHNLAGLFAECRARGLILPPEDEASCERLMTLLREGHAEYQFRYWERSLTTGDPDWIKEKVAKLSEAVVAEIKKVQLAAEAAAKGANEPLMMTPTGGMASIRPAK